MRRVLATKAALDNGWDLPPTDEAGALRCGSVRFPVQALIGAAGSSGFAVTFSDSRLPRELRRSGFDAGQAGEIVVGSDRDLDRLMRRAAELALSLPEAPLAEYNRIVSGTKIENTEAERLVKQRIGQDCFRAALLALWDHRCAVTGLDVPELLRASHAKPWADCESDRERLDPFNGFLLAPHLDALFDGGWITFAGNGEMLLSPRVSDSIESAFLIGVPRHLRWVTEEHVPFLAYHRKNVFRRCD
ncbi:MAG: hypothetical protein AMXMBFR72_11790 [Betaproteobacteria bacterium]